MSNVYILEPPTSGKVLLKTTVGDIDIELWTKEAPKACRNFIQLCMEGYYNGTIFHRVVRGFIAQGGDPNGDGTGGESIYGEPFKDEFHQRLKFVRRGLVAMANAGKDDNGSQFFFTLSATPELQNLHTIFGKITGETIFNMLKLEEGLIKNEKPEYPHKIIKAEVLNNPFSDIIPRVLDLPKEKKEKKKKEKTPGVKNFKLLSFGAEAEEDEEESTKINEKYAGKGKSTHDVLNDPKLSSQTAEEAATSNPKRKKDDDDDDENDDDKNEDGNESEESDREERLERIKKKLRGEKISKPKKTAPAALPDDDEDEERIDERKLKYQEIRKEIESVKREYHKNKLKREEEQKEKEEELNNLETFKEYKEEFIKYKNKKKEMPRKGARREEFTLSLLEKFKQKLNTAKTSKEEEGENETADSEDIDIDKNWLTHELKFTANDPVLAKDANTKDDDWFEIYDPRNKLNKRRRGEQSSKKVAKQ